MVRERLVPVQERTLFRVKAILRTLPIRRPWIRQSLAPRRSCIVWPLLAKRFVFSLSVQVRSLRKESMCYMVKAVTQTAPDVEIGWSRRRHASRRRSGGVRHKLVPEVGYQRCLFVRWTSRIKFFTLNTKAQMEQVHVQKFVRMKNM